MGVRLAKQGVKRGNPRYVEVELERITLTRGGRRVLDAIDWTIRPGERWVLAGANGAGKTQLLKLIAGSVWPTPTGRERRRYRWRGEQYDSPYEVKDEISYLGPERQDRYVRYGWNHSVLEVVGTGLHRSDIPLEPLTVADRTRIAAGLARLHAAELSERGFLSLSYGERRLVLLARALAARPKLLLLDELLNGLDAANRRRARRWLERTARAQLPWVLTTHRLDEVPASATHALILDRGRVVYRGLLARAPLSRWLAPAAEAAGTDRKPAAGGPRSRRLPATRQVLVKLERASVFLDERRTLSDLSITIHRGECWVVHGANGAGKTTLLRTLYGDHGVALGGRIERLGIVPGVPLESFKRRVGLVAPHLQSDHSPRQSVVETVQSGRYASLGLNAPPTAADRQAAKRALAFFGLGRLANRRLVELSYGQHRRVLFARAWVNAPELLLLDEPFAGVDAATRRDLLAHLETLRGRGTAVVLATHHRREWPAAATHELELARGSIRYLGPVRSS